VVDDAIIVVEAVEHHIDEGMDPREATIEKAMEEVGGPVVAIALILAAVFSDGGNSRHHRTAVSAVRHHHRDLGSDLGVQRADAQPGARGAAAESRRQEGRAAVLASASSILFNKFFGRTRTASSPPLVCLFTSRGFAMLVLMGVAVLAGSGKHAFPAASSRRKIRATCSSPCSCRTELQLQRTEAAQQKISDALLKTPGIEGVVAVNDFQPAHPGAEHQYGFFFVSLKPGTVRKSKEEQIEAIQSNRAEATRRQSDGLAFAFPPPAIPGIGTSGGVTMILRIAPAMTIPQLPDEELFAFLGALSKRPEIAAAIPSYLPAVPQLYADVDREKACTQQVDLNNIYTTMQTFMGGYLVNYFNRFGRQWQTYVEAEGDVAHQHRKHQPVLCAQRQRQPGAAGSLVNVRQITGPEFISALQRVQRRAAQHHRRARLQFRPGARRWKRSFSRPCRRAHGLRLSGHVFQEQQAEKGVPSWVVFGLSLLFVFLILAALYESWTLPFSVLLSTPVAILGAYLALQPALLENDIFATIGLIMLIGLSAKNAILIVEFAEIELPKAAKASASRR
jgi:hydrophobic/amphiphilic exporter-1 (mainly G- bacteria), HAE1 family